MAFRAVTLTCTGSASADVTGRMLTVRGWLETGSSGSAVSSGWESSEGCSTLSEEDSIVWELSSREPDTSSPFREQAVIISRQLTHRIPAIHRFIGSSSPH